MSLSWVALISTADTSCARAATADADTEDDAPGDGAPHAHESGRSHRSFSLPWWWRRRPVDLDIAGSRSGDVQVWWRTPPRSTCIDTSTASSLDNVELHPRFGRVIPTNNGEAIAFILYLQQYLPNVGNVAVLFSNDPYASPYHAWMQSSGGLDDRGMVR